MSDLWYMLQSAERYLYHYTRADTLRQHILPNMQLLTSTFDRLNDPKEYKDFRIGGAEWADDCPADLLDVLGRELKRNWRVGCFVRDPPEAVFSNTDSRPGADIFQAMHERGHSRPRMWAQYGQNHAGACIVLDKKALGRAFREAAVHSGLKLMAGAIVYENSRVAGSLGPGPFMMSMNEVRAHGVEEAVRLHGERYWRELFLTKNRDWEAEREFRWLLCGRHEGPVLVNVTGVLSGVLLGPHFPKAPRARIEAHCQSLGIETATMDWSNGVPQIHPTRPLRRR